MRTLSVTFFAVALSSLAACDDYDQFRDDVIVCEQAYDYLSRCCGRPLGISCEYSYKSGGLFGGKSETNDPDISLSRGKLILSHACSDLRGAGFCD